MSSVAPPAQAVVRRGVVSEAENQETDLIRRLKQQRALDFQWFLQALNSLPITISQPTGPSLLPQFRPQRQLPPSTNTRIIELPDIPPPPVSPPRAAVSRFARANSFSSSSSGSIYLPPPKESRRLKKNPLELEREAYDGFIAEIKRLLGPLMNEEENYDDGSVFLCWGSATSCRVLSVGHFQRDMDHELFWKKLHQAWYRMRGEWRRKIPWYGIRNVKVVDIRLVGPVYDRPDQFHGVFRSVDAELQKEKDKLRRKIEKFQEAEAEAERKRFWEDLLNSGVEDYDFDDFDDCGDDCNYRDECIYDEKLGRTIHGDTCITQTSPFPEDCNEREYPESKNRLNGLMMESLRTSLLQNPQMAVYHKLSNSDLIHIKSEIRTRVHGNPYRGLGQLVFRGLLVEDGWAFDGGIGILYMPLAAVASMLIVLLAWLAYGDWAIAWNVGSCMVPLLLGLASALPQARAPRV